MTAEPLTSALGVVVIEDDVLYRASLSMLLSHAPGFRLHAAYASAEEALEALAWPEAAAGWDLALMDIDLPGISGVEATRRLKTRRPDGLVVVLTVFEEPGVILEAICAGADGYLLKRTAPEELLEQLRAVAGGGAPLTSGVARTVLQLVREPRESRDPRGAATGPGATAGRGAAEAVRLTERERDVLRALVDGLAYKQVADRLGISIDTVRTHIRGIYGKLQVHSVAEAVVRAIREGLA
jgi:DNA-binding NarL/FixJ family response regulator